MVDVWERKGFKFVGPQICNRQTDDGNICCVGKAQKVIKLRLHHKFLNKCPQKQKLIKSTLRLEKRHKITTHLGGQYILQTNLWPRSLLACMGQTRCIGMGGAIWMIKNHATTTIARKHSHVK